MDKDYFMGRNTRHGPDNDELRSNEQQTDQGIFTRW
jgi:hypothetical protein